MNNKSELLTLHPEPLDAAAYRAARRRWDSISKPLDALGDFETLVCRLAAMQHLETPKATRRAALVFCADNGVVEEGVSQCGKEGTFAVATALGKGVSSVSILAKSARVDVVPVDVGIDAPDPIPGLLDAKVARGTKNIALEPATTVDETRQAMTVGFDAVCKLADDGYDVVAVGEMGIGNTTTSTALLCAILGLDVDAVVGRGAGLDDEGLLRKKNVIRRALALHLPTLDAISDARSRTVMTLATLGGLEIAALVGACIGGAVMGVPIALDGVVTTTAALVANAIFPGTKDFLFATHAGRERGSRFALATLGLAPLVDGAMAFGEATGAVMFFPTLDVVLDYFVRASTFQDINLKAYRRFDE